MKEDIIALKNSLIEEIAAKNSWGKNELKILILEVAVDQNKTQETKELISIMIDSISSKNSWGKNELKFLILETTLDFVLNNKIVN